MTLPRPDPVLHSDREWLVPMGIVAAIQFALWSLLWRLGLAGAPLIGCTTSSR